MFRSRPGIVWPITHMAEAPEGFGGFALGRPRRRRGALRRDRRRSLVEPLEPRILLSADLPVAPVEGGLPADPDPAASEELRLPDRHEGPGVEQHAPRRELVFVDAGVEGYEALVADLRDAQPAPAARSRSCCWTPAATASPRSATRWPPTANDLDAVHVVSHGSERGVQLGDTWLTSESLDGSAPETWPAGGMPSAADADLLLYGCNLAVDGSEGQSLVEELSLLTGADVGGQRRSYRRRRAGRRLGPGVRHRLPRDRPSLSAVTLQSRMERCTRQRDVPGGRPNGYASTSDTTLDELEAADTPQGSLIEVEVDADVASTWA